MLYCLETRDTWGKVRQELTESRAQHVRLEGMTQMAVGTPIDKGHCGNINIRFLDVRQNFPLLVILGAYRESCGLPWQQFPMTSFKLGLSNYFTLRHTQAYEDTPKNLNTNTSFKLFNFQFISKLLATCDWNK